MDTGVGLRMGGAAMRGGLACAVDIGVGLRMGAAAMRGGLACAVDTGVGLRSGAAGLLPGATDRGGHSTGPRTGGGRTNDAASGPVTGEWFGGTGPTGSCCGRDSANDTFLMPSSMPEPHRHTILSQNSTAMRNEAALKILGGSRSITCVLLTDKYLPRTSFQEKETSLYLLARCCSTTLTQC